MSFENELNIISQKYADERDKVLKEYDLKRNNSDAKHQADMDNIFRKADEQMKKSQEDFNQKIDISRKHTDKIIERYAKYIRETQRKDNEVMRRCSPCGLELLIH
jgi:hypothetical protein